MKPPDQRDRKRIRLWGWWYLSIGLGFILLGLRYLIAGAPVWSIGLRWVIAVGFLLLGVGTLRGPAGR